MTHLNHFTLFNNRKSLFPGRIRIKIVGGDCVGFCVVLGFFIITKNWALGVLRARQDVWWGDVLTPHSHYPS